MNLGPIIIVGPPIALGGALLISLGLYEELPVFLAGGISLLVVGSSLVIISTISINPGVSP